MTPAERAARRAARRQRQNAERERQTALGVSDINARRHFPLPGITHQDRPGSGSQHPSTTPLTPAYGTYDPQLDQQLDAAHRGFGDLKEDIGIAGKRAIEDYGIAKGDVETGYGRSLADLLTARDRGKTDFGNAVAGVDVGYNRLANAQSQAQNAGGVLGGAIEQARLKREGNRSRDVSPLNESFARFNQDSTLAEGRLGEDKTSALGKLLMGFGRGVDDRKLQLSRGKRENIWFGKDIAELRTFQAEQAGLLPTGPHGGSQHPDTTPPSPAANRGRATWSGSGPQRPRRRRSRWSGGGPQNPGRGL